MPTCKVCGKEKPKEEFYERNKSTCKECVKERNYQQRVARNKKKAEKLGIEYHPLGHRPNIEVPKGYKYCNECKQVLPISEFGFHRKNGNPHLNSVCKKCAVVRVLRCPNRVETQAKSNANKEEKRKIDAEYRRHLRDIDKKYYKSEKGIKQKMLERARSRAKGKGLECTITVDDIILPEKCPILEVPLRPGDAYDYDFSYSLDRIDNSKGYIPGNVMVISNLANKMKNCATKEQLKTFIKNINKYITE